MQQALETLVILVMASSEITSKPPVAAVTRRTPRSKRSSFLSSIDVGESFLSFEMLGLRLYDDENFSLKRLYLFL
jgi:hypothetical protein